MFRRPPSFVAQSEQHGTTTSARLARALRAAPVELPEMTRARLERNLVEAWRARGAHAVPMLRLRPNLTRGVWMGSLAGSAAFGAMLGLVMLRQEPAGGPGASAASAPPAVAAVAATNVAHFDLVIADAGVQSGMVAPGQVLESGKHGHIEVSLAQSRVDIAPESRVRFDRIDPHELRLSLVQGRVDVAFHPEHKGEQSLTVETSSARVVVVGTRFAVEAAVNRDTRVSVSEGIVRVEPRRGGSPLLVRAGERVTVDAEREGAFEAEPVAGEPQLMAAGRVPTSARVAGTEEGNSRGHAAKASSTASRARSDARLEKARNLLLQGKHAAARDILKGIIGGSAASSARVEALVLMAESYTSQGEVPRAAEAYRQAVETAPGEAAGHNALFALARLLDRYTHDNDGAAAAYREYLAKAPHGPLARQAREALCRISECR